MLPFLRPRKQAGVQAPPTQVTRKPDGDLESDKDSENQGLMSAAQDLIQAIHSKDAKAVSAALKAAFEICESEPHYEDHEFEGTEDTE